MTDQSTEKQEMIQIAESKKMKVAIENMLTKLDSKALTPEGKIKSYNNSLYFPKKKNNIKMKSIDLGKNKISNNKTLILTKTNKTKAQLSLNQMNSYMDFEKVKFPLYVRSRKPKDKIKIAPRNVTKSLKQLFVENKIPVENRGEIVLLFDNDDNLIYVEKIGVSELVKIDSNTNKMIKIKFEVLDGWRCKRHFNFRRRD